MGPMVRIVLAVVVLLVIATPARAIVLRAPAKQPPTRTLNLAQAIEIARAQWPTSPCAGREHVEVGPIPGRDGEAGHPTIECYVRVSPRPQGVELCRVLVHEFGHHAGQVHSDDPTIIMFDPAANVPYGPCDEAAERAAVVPPDLIASWWLIDGMRGGARARCVAARPAPVTVRCGVRDRWGKLKHWRVRVTGTAYGAVDVS